MKTGEQAAATKRFLDEMTALGAERGRIGAALNKFLTDGNEEQREES
jgi:hypothetical protein